MKSAGEGLRFFCALQGGNDMAYVKEHAPSEVYHLAKQENLNSILDDGMIRRFSDTECWFCADLQKDESVHGADGHVRGQTLL